MVQNLRIYNQIPLSKYPYHARVYIYTCLVNCPSITLLKYIHSVMWDLQYDVEYLVFNMNVGIFYIMLSIP